jgi:CheY-like chemotaxis protein
MSKGRLLAVDDNPDNLVLLAGILERAGYEVRAANSARRALPMLESDAPELVLLDVEMPDMNGLELCRAIKTRPALAPVPVIFLSALHELPDKLQGFDAGGVDYIAKPFEEEEVLARVDTQLRLSRLQRDLEQRNEELLRMNERLLLEQQRVGQAFAAVSELLPGRLLDGAYRVDEPIGEGGFSIVYRGTDIRLQRPVAIKILRPMGGDLKRLRRFQTEGIAACRVRHRNAVDVLAAGFSQGLAYLVMELLQGRMLSELMKAQPVVPVDRTLTIGVQIADALTAAHAARVIHRDVTPRNIFLHREGDEEVVKVLDFGIARLVDDSGPAMLSGTTGTGELVGTPEYMPPERLLGGTYDASADVYSLGVILYRMLTGKRLFQGQNRLDLIEAIQLHLSASPRPLATLAPEVPEAVAELVMSALAKDPEERPTSREVAERLRDLRAAV